MEKSVSKYNTAKHRREDVEDSEVEVFGHRNNKVVTGEVNTKISRSHCFENSDSTSNSGFVCDSSRQTEETLKVRLFHCKLCSASFSTSEELRKHNLVHLPNYQKRDRFLCYNCLAVFEYKAHLNRHFIRHNRGINFECNHCKLKRLTMRGLDKHCEIMKHDRHDERPLIRIDRKLSMFEKPEKTVPLTRANVKYEVLKADKQSPGDKSLVQLSSIIAPVTPPRRSPSPTSASPRPPSHLVVYMFAPEIM
uniref:C2H2-type domain-containing protein n=1 Tax=Glossina pallidipes TaxID=7398 RepID=A0A1B0AJ17_GLOPL